MEKKYTLTLDDTKLKAIIEKRDNSLPELVKEFQKNYVKINTDKMGNEFIVTNPYAISTFFLKPINPVTYIEPEYNSEQLAKVWELYSRIIETINMEINIFPPSLSQFCKFAGLTLEKMQELKINSNDNMKLVVNKIHSEIYDSNILLSQTKDLAYKPTENRMKIENQIIEKKAPNINIDLGIKEIDLDKMNERLAEIQSLTKKKIDYEGK